MKEIKFKHGKLPLVIICFMFILHIIAILLSLSDIFTWHIGRTFQKYDSWETMFIPLSIYVMGGPFLAFLALAIHQDKLVTIYRSRNPAKSSFRLEVHYLERDYPFSNFVSTDGYTYIRTGRKYLCRIYLYAQTGKRLLPLFINNFRPNK